jgi:hypothetical protein
VDKKPSFPFSDKLQKRDALMSMDRKLSKSSFSDLNEYDEFFQAQKERGRGTYVRHGYDYDTANQPNEIIVGYYDQEYSTEPVTINVSSRTNWLIVSNLAGSGKSVLGFNILEQYKYKLNPHIVVFDSKPEFSFRKQPNRDPYMRNSLMKIHRNIPLIQPRGAPMHSVAPKFIFPSTADEEMFDGIPVRYDLNEMEWSDIITLFGLSAEGKGDSKSLNKLNMAVYGFSDEEEFNEALADGTLEERPIVDTSALLKAFSEGDIRDDSLRNNLKSMISTKVLGTSSEFNIVDTLNSSENILQYVTMTATDDSYLNRVRAYMSVEIKRITRARKAFSTPDFARGSKVLQKPVVLYFSEFQRVFPKPPLFPSIKKEIMSIYDVARYQNVSIIADVASILDCDKAAIKQSDIIISFKLTGSSIEHLRKERNLSWDQYQQIQNLAFDKNSPPQQAVIIPASKSDESEFEAFWPLPPQSNINVEQKL